MVAGTVSGVHTDRVIDLEELRRDLGFSRTFSVNQIHSATIVHTDQSTPGSSADAIMCSETDILLGVFTADCTPVLIYGHELLAVIHAGWRGIHQRIFDVFFEELPVGVSNIHAIIGPTICADCYEVGPEFAGYFSPPYLSPGNHGHWHLDLPELAYASLTRLGVSDDRIYRSPDCTCCTAIGLHSHRKTRTLLRNISYIGFRSSR